MYHRGAPNKREPVKLVVRNFDGQRMDLVLSAELSRESLTQFPRLPGKTIECDATRTLSCRMYGEVDPNEGVLSKMATSNKEAGDARAKRVDASQVKKNDLFAVRLLPRGKKGMQSYTTVKGRAFRYDKSDPGTLQLVTGEEVKEIAEFKDFEIAEVWTLDDTINGEVERMLDEVTRLCELPQNFDLQDAVDQIDSLKARTEVTARALRSMADHIERASTDAEDALLEKIKGGTHARNTGSDHA